MTHLQRQWQDASYWTGKEDACNRPTSKLQNARLPTQNRVSFQNFCFKEHQYFQVTTLLNVNKPESKAPTYCGSERLLQYQNSALNLRKAVDPDIPSHLHFRSVSYVVYFALSARPCPLQFSPHCSGIQFSDDVVLKWPRDPDLYHPCWFISSSRWELLGYQKPTATHVTVKYLGARSSS